MKVDLHLHTTASDGTDAPEVLVRRAWELGLSVISVTDHDTTAGIEAVRAALPHEMTLVNGVELSCVTDGTDGFRCHILGYGFDPSHPAMLSAIDAGAEKRREKLLARLEYIKRGFGIEFNADEVAELLTYNAVSKIHIAKLLVAHGYAESIGGAIDKYLGVRSPDDRIDAKMAIDAIISSGGIPVWAHPVGGEREKRLDSEELFRRAQRLKELGIMGLEGYYSRYTESDRAPILDAAARLDLLVSGGSDYHGVNKTVPLGCLDAEGGAVSCNAITLLERLGI